MRFASWAGPSVVVFLLVIITAVTLTTRTGFIREASNGELQPPHQEVLRVCAGDLRPCTRVLGAALSAVIGSVTDALGSTLYWSVRTTPFFVDARDAVIQVHERLEISLMRNVVVPGLHWFGLFLILLAPLIAGARLVERSWWWSIPVFLLMGFAVMGWPPPVVSIFFRLGDLFAQWPKYYFLFSEPYAHYDLTAAAFLVLFVVWYSNAIDRPAWQFALIAALGQSIMEYVGAVVCVTVFLVSLHGVIRKHLSSRQAFWFSGWTFFGAAAAAGILVLAFFLQGHDLAYSQNESVGTFERLFSPALNERLFNNIVSLKILVALMINLTGIPAYFSFFAGALVTAFQSVLSRIGYTSDPQFSGRERQVIVVGLSIVAGYYVVFFLGLPFIGFPAEMGRQFMPMMVVAVLPSYLIGKAVTMKLMPTGSPRDFGEQN